MRRLVESLKKHQLPTRVTRSDWKEAADALFSPHFRRKTQLRENIDPFLIELRNLARILEHPEHMALMKWCLTLHRRVLRTDRAGAYRAMHELFQNMQSSDDRWLNMFETSGSLEAGAAAQDRIFQLFTTIDSVAEGCFKPQLQILYSFALRDTSTGWPQNVGALDFGALVAGFPANLRTQAPLLLADPDLGIAVNQWRNIAAHKTFALVGPQTLEVKYGKGKIQTRRFGIHRLRGAWHWLLRTQTAVGLANTITYVEHIRELDALALPPLERRFSATLLHVTHGLSTVGFQSQSWEIENRDGRLTVRDRLGRKPRDALIHASQQLVQLAIGVLADVAIRTRVDKVAIRSCCLVGRHLELRV